MSVDCDPFDYAYVNFADNAGNTTLRLLELHVCDKPNSLGKQGARQMFVKSVVEKLRPTKG
jgi:hypothetical protein